MLCCRWAFIAKNHLPGLNTNVIKNVVPTIWRIGLWLQSILSNTFSTKACEYKLPWATPSLPWAGPSHGWWDQWSLSLFLISKTCTEDFVRHVLGILIIANFKDMCLELSFILNLAISLAGHAFSNWTNCIWINVGDQRSKLGHQSLKVISPDEVITSLIIHEKVSLKVEKVSLKVTCSRRPLLQVVVPAVLDNISRLVKKMIW